MENKVVCVEEVEVFSKYVVSEDMEVIDDLEEGSDGGSNDSEDFSDVDEGIVIFFLLGVLKLDLGRVLFMLYNYLNILWL